MDLVDKYANNDIFNDMGCLLCMCALSTSCAAKLGDSDTTVFWIGQVPLRKSVASTENEGHF